jgi:hypothetical protein
MALETRSAVFLERGVYRLKWHRKNSIVQIMHITMIFGAQRVSDNLGFDEAGFMEQTVAP